MKDPKENKMANGSILISGYVQARISMEDANRRVEKFKKATKKRSESATIEIDVEEIQEGSKKIKFLVAGDSESLTNDIDDLVESTLSKGLNYVDNAVWGKFAVTNLRQVKPGCTPAMSVFSLDFDGHPRENVEVSNTGKVYRRWV